MTRLRPHWRRLTVLSAFGGLVVAVLAASTVLGAQQPVEAPSRLRYALAGDPRIGVTLRDVLPEDVSPLQLPSQAGAIVESVRSGGPAAAAGLAANDVVVSFDGESVRSARHLSRLVEETPAQKPVSVAVIRNGARVDLTVTPQSGGTFAGALLNGDAPVARLLRELPAQVQPEIELFAAPGSGRLGVRVQNLAGDLNQYFGVDGGVLVVAVTPDSPAAAAGLQAGDVITAWNGESVESVADLIRRVTTASGTVGLTVVRERETRTMSVDLPQRAEPVPTRRYGI